MSRPERDAPGPRRPLLSLRGVCKRFGDLAALVDVDLEVMAGEVHAVLGENGAGKSTLMRVIYGLVRPDAGTITVRDRPVRFAHPRDARQAGIGMVHQELALFDALSVGENLARALCPEARWWLWPATIAAAAQRISGELGVDLGDLARPAGTLPIGRRQMLEIVRALAGDPAVLILDEPTAVLTPSEVAQLTTVLGRLRRHGTAVLFITHKLHEVMAIADRITVMRRGRVVARVDAGRAREPELAELMVGPLAVRDRTVPTSARGPAVLRLERLSATDDRGVVTLEEVDLTLHRGEVFGIAGVDGNGQTELFEVLAGLRAPRAGTITASGTALAGGDPAAMAAAGIACVPPDRMRQGVIADMSVRENAILHAALLRRLAPGVLTRPAAERAFAEDLVDTYAIRAPSVEVPVRILSGGNVQKLVLARTLALRPHALVAVNPTRGLDVRAAEDVHAAIAATLRRETGVLLISTDLDELIARAHRIAVLYRGRLSRAFERPFAAAQIGALMAGSDAG